METRKMTEGPLARRGNIQVPSGSGPEEPPMRSQIDDLDRAAGFEKQVCEGCHGVFRVMGSWPESYKRRCQDCRDAELEHRGFGPGAGEKQKRERAVRGAIRRAEKHGLPCDLRRAGDLRWPRYCPILGIPLDRRDREHTPEIDRKHPLEGYTRANCQVISGRANRIKNDATPEELKALARASS